MQQQIRKARETSEKREEKLRRIDRRLSHACGPPPGAILSSTYLRLEL